MRRTDTDARIGYGVNEAAELLSVSRPTVYRLMATGDLRFTRIRGRRIIPRSALVELVEGKAE